MRATPVARPRGFGLPASTRSPTRTRRRAAVRWIVSPSGTPSACQTRDFLLTLAREAQRHDVAAVVGNPGGAHCMCGRHQLITRQRPAEQVTLSEVASGGTKPREVRRCLDPLGDDL